MDGEDRNRQHGGAVSSEVPSNTVNGDAIETIVVILPESAGASIDSSREAIANVHQETRESSNPKNSNQGVSAETVLVIGGDDGGSHVKNKGLGLSKESEKTNTKSKVSEAKNCAGLINVTPKGGKGFIEDWNTERVCRICHLASDQSPDAKTDASASQLIQLGCDCKDELGIAHSHCAEAWFKLKGNRMCEICGETAKNVEGVGDNGFMEEWNEGRSGDMGASERRGGCWRGQPLCNLLMACLVIAFVLPWFFRINIF